MVFSSIVFLFYFLPFVLLLYYASGKSNLVILLASLLFYAWGEPQYVVLLVVFILFNWLAGLAIASRIGWQRTAILAATISANVLFLVFFKYLDFLVGQLDTVLTAAGATPIAVRPIALPLGISFFTFQGMSYLIDIYRGEVVAQRNLLTFATYKSMFPQLIAGPIVRYRQIAGKIERRRVSLFRLQYGIVLFIVGMSQKVLIANTVAVPADELFGTAAGDLTLPAAWLGVVCYTLQIYFDFAGYSNMAIGMGHMMGFGYPPNFNRPYVSQSITEFWRRWHISLSTWFRDYLYVPLGGNRRGRLRTYVNLFLVFVICGFWHGASWTFAIWGLWHGGFLIVERMGLGGLLRRCWRPLRHLYVMLAVMLGWVFFRCDTLAGALGYLGTMFGLGDAGATALPVVRYAPPSVWAAIVIGSVFAVLRAPGVRSIAPRWRPAVARYPASGALMQAGASVACLVLLVLSALTLATGSFNPFIYFRF